MRISTIAIANLKRRKGKAAFLVVGMAIGIGTAVALLNLSGSLKDEIGSQLEFDGDKLWFEFHLAPPLLARRDKATGLQRKMTFGPQMMKVFKLLARLKWLRGTLFDPFAYSAERRMERNLIADYVATLEEVLAKLNPANHHLAVGIAAIPEKIRGFGHVKQRHLAAAQADDDQGQGERHHCHDPAGHPRVQLLPREPAHLRRGQVRPAEVPHAEPGQRGPGGAQTGQGRGRGGRGCS